MSSSLRTLLKLLGGLATAAWLAYTIDLFVFEADPNQYGFKNPEVEAQMKACSGDSVKTRYDCKEQAILAGQREKFIGWLGGVAIMFGPPILGWLLFTRSRTFRIKFAEPSERRPPSIRKWRVR